MRQGDKIERMPWFLHADDVSDNCHEWWYIIEELRKCQFTDGQDKPGPQDRKLGSQPSAAKGYLLTGWDAVPSVCLFSGETSADRSHVDRLSELLLVDTKFVLKPLEHCFAGGPGKWTSKLRLLGARRLADQHDSTQYRSTRYRGRLHFWTASARSQGAEMPFQEKTPLVCLRFHFSWQFFKARATSIS